MFNTQKFNTGKFNIPSSDVASVSGNISATGGLTGTARVVYSASGRCDGVSSIEKANAARIVKAECDMLHAKSGATCEYYNRVAVSGEPLEGVSGIEAKAVEVFGITFMRLSDIVLKPGQELVIDTENMTAVIDGENAIHLLSDDSEFFFLAQGSNTITYSDRAAQRKINLKVMWKNRWL